MKTTPELSVVHELLADRPKALEFLILYSGYCALADDIADGDREPRAVVELCAVASSLYNCEYWRTYGRELLIAERLNALSFHDSLRLEQSSDGWEMEFCRFLGQSGCNMIFAVLMIELGEEEAKRVSLQIRMSTYRRHIQEDAD